MTTVTSETPLSIAVVEELCPICGEPLDPEGDEVLCAECEEDQAEKWADYCAEIEQAWHPY